MIAYELDQTNDQVEEVNIGLVIAGAVTAGSYSAGVLDYLFETLDLWHAEHEKDPTSITRPNVTIDVIGGASAGSIVAAAAVLGRVFDLASPVETDKLSENNEHNLLFDLWVNLGENKVGDERKVIQKLLNTGDLHQGKIHSLLNSDFADDLMKQVQQKICRS